MKTAICLHLYYQDLWPWFKSRLDSILDENTHLYVTVVETDTPYIKSIKEHSKEVFLVENRGVDVAPFLQTYDKIKHLNYKFFVKLHSKKSVQIEENGYGDKWRQHLVDCIIGSKIVYKNIITQLQDMHNVPFIYGHKHFLYGEPCGHPNLEAAMPYIHKALDLLGLSLENVVKPEDTRMPYFIAGTMFLTNDVYMSHLYSSLKNIPNIIPEFEPGKVPDSLAHGFERVFGYYNSFIGGKFIGGQFK